MPLMGSLYIGASGLQTSQNTLNTTAHNLSNLDTKGYVRQQALLGTSIYNTIRIDTKAVANQQVGSGVIYSRVRQVRDEFLDQTYRRESGRSAFYDVSLQTMEHMEGLLGELEDSSFSNSLNDLWTAVQELAKNPASSTIQTLLVQRSSQFISRAQSVYQGLSDYQDNLNEKIEKDIARINEIGASIKQLNDSIRGIEAAGFEKANDLRDTRNSLVDELASLANISYENDVFGNVCIKIEGTDFVTTADSYEIGLHTDESTGFYTPYWTHCATYSVGADGNKHLNLDGCRVFNLDRVISSETDTDIGSVKSTLLARGEKRANYTDLQDKDYYDKNISKSILMNIQAEFDQLIHGVVTSMNKVLENASDPVNGYLCNPDGSPLQLFTKITTNAYEHDGTKWNYVEEDKLDPSNPDYKVKTEFLYSTMNVHVNTELIKQPTLLYFVKPDGSEDFQTAANLAAEFEKENYILNPNLKTECNFTDYYSNLVSQVANTGSVMASICASQDNTVEQTDAAREQIMGVSSEEELSNMIKFQNAYNASSRYINVIDEMLEHILSTLGA